jgi:hypothetical protein
MVSMRHGRWGALATVFVVAVAACQAGSGRGDLFASRSTTRARADTAGAVSTPLRPFVATRLPPGWTQGQVETRPTARGGVDEPSQAVFAPRVTTPSSGRAVLIGWVNEMSGPPFKCETPVPPPRRARIVRDKGGITGVTIVGPEDADCAYVVGRDISDATLRRAAGSVEWGATPSQAPTARLPRGFHLRATSGLAFSSFPLPVLTSFKNGEDNYVTLQQANYNAPGLLVAGIWKSVLQGRRDEAQGILVSGKTVVRIEGTDTPASRHAVRVIERGLRRGPPRS